MAVPLRLAEPWIEHAYGNITSTCQIVLRDAGGNVFTGTIVRGVWVPT
jgi:hypothetical protein